MALLAKDVSALLSALGIQQASFVGHSMGGAIVQQICIDYPEKVKKAVICSSFAKVPYTSAMQIDTVIEMALAGVPEEFIFQTVLPWLFSSNCLAIKGNPEKIIKKMVNDPYPQKPEGYLGQGEALKNFDSTDKLSKIRCPCLIIVGEDDLYAPISCSKAMKEKIQMAQMKIVPHQGHMITEEIPEMLCNEIKAFLSS
jgi:pimeloyl-ACP methyl ester carboxylesterase